MDDSLAKKDWQWHPENDLEKTVQIMLKRVGDKIKITEKTQQQIQLTESLTEKIVAIM